MSDRALGFASPLSVAPPSSLTEDRAEVRDQCSGPGVRWVISGEPFPAGVLKAAPGELGQWLRTENLLCVLAEPHGLLAWPGPQAAPDWAQRLQSVIADELPASDSWQIAADENLALKLAAEDIIHGELASLIQGHGGQIDVIAVHGDRVDVELGGQCAGCSAADQTLNAKLRGALTRRMGRAIQINDITPKRPSGGVTWLKLGRRGQ